MINENVDMFGFPLLDPSGYPFLGPRKEIIKGIKGCLILKIKGKIYRTGFFVHPTQELSFLWSAWKDDQ